MSPSEIREALDKLDPHGVLTPDQELMMISETALWVVSSAARAYADLLTEMKADESGKLHCADCLKLVKAIEDPDFVLPWSVE